MNDFLFDDPTNEARLEIEWQQVLVELLEIIGGQTMFEAILGKLTPMERDRLADLILELANLRLHGDRSADQERMIQIRKFCDQGWRRLE